MATISEATIQQSTGEVRKWTADFSNDLPLGGTITGGTAIHTPPSGAASTPTVSYTTTTVSATLGPLPALGIHYLDIQADYSNNETAEVRVAFTNNYPATAARSTMLELIADLRAMTHTGPNDYKIAGVPHWSDAQLQKILDRHRQDLDFFLMTPFPKRLVNDLQWFEYRIIGWENFEQTDGGSAIFLVEDSTGADAGTLLWTADYNLGIVTFASDTNGKDYYVTARSYDLNGAAAEVWRRKSGHYAAASDSFDFSTDNMSVKRSQKLQQAREMYKYFAEMARPRITTLYRSELDAGALR